MVHSLHHQFLFFALCKIKTVASIERHLSFQGILSRAVCWDALESQLFYSRIGHDADRRRAFQRVLETMKRRGETRTGCTSARVATAAHSLGLDMEEVSGLGHSESPVHTRTRTESSAAAQERELFTDTGVEESYKNPGQLLHKSMHPQNGSSSLSESSQHQEEVSSRASGRLLKAAAGIFQAKSKKRRVTPKEVSVIE